MAGRSRRHLEYYEPPGARSYRGGGRVDSTFGIEPAVGSESRPQRERTGHYERHSALAERGWLVVLSKAELALWHAYEKHASRDGEAYPDSQTLADLSGCGKSHIGTLRKRLESFGLLEIISQASGRGRPCRVRMLVPPPPPFRRRARGKKVPELSEKGSHFAPEKVPDLDQKGSHSAPEKVPTLAEKGSQTGELLNKEELPKNSPLELPKNSPDAPGEDWLEPLTPLLALAEANRRPAPVRAPSDPPPAQSEAWYAEVVEDWMRHATPAAIRSPEFFIAYGRWLVHLGEIRKEPGPSCVRAQLLKLGGLGATNAIRAIEHSIASGYTALVEPRESKRTARDQNRAEFDRFVDELELKTGTDA